MNEKFSPFLNDFIARCYFFNPLFPSVFFCLHVKIIDSNLSAIRVLEPLAEEIAQIRAFEDDATNNGASAPRFVLKLDKRGLSTTHISAIAR